MTEMITMFLRFAGSPDVGWKGDWPPPPRMWIATGHQTGMVVHIDPDDQALFTPEDWAALPFCATIKRYRRDTYSMLPADVGPNVIRGASYIPEDV